jgi:hypothetical protein
LARLAGLPIPTKQVERLTREVGTQRVAQRDAAVAEFAALPLAQKFEAPAGVEAPDLAAVLVDGGRLQIRERTAASVPDLAPPTPDAEEDWESEVVAEKGHWREDKVGLLLHLESEISAVDPCPQIPAGFLDLGRIPKLVREIGKVAAATEDAEDAEGAYEPPGGKRQKVVGSCRPWRAFAQVVAQAAWQEGFHQAKRKAFVADGSANNWRLRARFFGSFEPVLDFIHALTYVYAAATAGRGVQAGWECYRRWITWVWQGEVSEVIAELAVRQQEVGLPGEGESATSVPSVVARSLRYVQNHQEKMKYAQYRREGLPITSSRMESVVKQMNYRVKGSEKFWCQEGAEAIVQLRADHLSDGDPLGEFFRQRQANATGQRAYRRSA